MNNQLELLIQNQKLDTQLNRQKDEQRRLPQIIDSAIHKLEETRRSLTIRMSEVDQVNKERKEKEMALQAIEDGISKMRMRTTDLKTNKEYQALLKEIETANTEKGRVEEELLSVMEKLDQIKASIPLQNKAVSEEEQSFHLLKEQTDARSVQLVEQILAVEQTSHQLTQTIEAKLLTEYRHLAATRKGLAVMPLSGNSCSGCHFSLPPQLVSEVKIGEKIMRCSYCHRVLYSPPQE